MIAVLFVALIGLIYIPQLWVKIIMKRHAGTIDEMPGTGAELARHLLDRFELEDYRVEKTDSMRDHFSPTDKAVRLGPGNFDGKSITAIAVAAHEVGHAIQHAREEPIFLLRKKYLPAAHVFGQIGIWLLRLMPIVVIVVKAPAAIFGVVVISLVFQLIGALTYLVVLPEEWDASFNKALPLLIEGEYVPTRYHKDMQQVLKAAALTYFAGALASILNLARLFLIFRR